MTPTEFEQYIASLLTAEGWEARVTPPQRDFGLDVICTRPGRRLGVQVKMYGAGRPINAQIVMHLHGAAAYQDCSEAMIVTDGRVLDDAKQVAEKLGIEVWRVSVPRGEAADPITTNSEGGHIWTFDRIWEEHVMPLAGEVLKRRNGSTNEIISVDWSGLKRRSSRGSVGIIDIEIFRWTVEQLLSGEAVFRDEINAQYPKRASSGIVLVIASLPMFETVRVGSKQALRLRSEK